MSRKIRNLPHPQAIVEITQRSIQGRFLFKPSERLNALFIGCLVRAMKNTGATVHAVVVLSNHFHLLATFATVEQMSQFMCQVKTNLSKEIRRLYDWPGTLFDGRYGAIPLSDEPEIQIERLRYLLSQGAKEGLVLSPKDWPGVHSAEALSHGEPLQGIWVDRTELNKARQKDRTLSEEAFTSQVELHLTPLPVFSELSELKRKKEVETMVREIEDETLRKHKENGTAPIGLWKILRRNPHYRPREMAESPRPASHAVTQAARRSLMEGLREFILAYKAASERFRAGDLQATFPENCFPPRPPFVAPMLI